MADKRNDLLYGTPGFLDQYRAALAKLEAARCSSVENAMGLERRLPMVLSALSPRNCSASERPLALSVNESL